MNYCFLIIVDKKKKKRQGFMIIKVKSNTKQLQKLIYKL